MLIYALGLGAALCLGLGFVLQQHAAQAAPPADALHFRLLLGLLHQPIWLLGIAAMVAGQLLSAGALAKADVSLVEPLLTANLLFALVIARLIYRQPLCLNEWLGALLLSAGVTAFIVAGRPSGGNPDGDSLPRWVLAMGIAVLAEVCVRLSRGRHGSSRAMLLALAAGLLFGLQDGLTRRAFRDVGANLPFVFTHWALYALIGVGVVSVLLAQSAFEAGPLRASLPTITAAEPIAGIAVGIVVFQEHMRVTPLTLAFETAGLAAMVVGVLLVGTSRTMSALGARKRRHPRPLAHSTLQPDVGKRAVGSRHD